MNSAPIPAQAQKFKRSVHSQYIKLLCGDLETLGIPIEKSLKAAHLPADFMENGEGMVSIYEFQMLYNFAWSLTDEVFLGIGIGSKIYTNHHGPLGYLLATSPSIEAALNYLVKFIALRTQLIELAVEDDGTHLRVLVKEKEKLDFARIYFLEAFMGVVINSLFTIFQRDLIDLQLEFSYSGEGREEEYQEFFQCPLRFSQEHNAFIFSKKSITQKNMMADAKACRLAEIECQNLYDNIVLNDGLRNQIEKIVLNSDDPFPNLEEAATKLGMSKSTLIRRLSKADTSFKSIVNDIRYELASYYLIETNLSIENVAEKLGFLDTSNFSRVFKRWRNTTPSQYRKEFA